MNPFTEALDTLKARGWIKRRLSDPLGCCLLGAINENYNSAYPYLGILVDVIHEQYPETVENLPNIWPLGGVSKNLVTITDFNDIIAQWKDIERVLEKAAVIYDERT